MNDLAIEQVLKSAYFLERDQPGRVVDEFLRALSLDPQATRPRHALATLLWLTDRWDEAVAQLREASRRDPQSLESLLLLGDALEAMGERDETLQLFRQAVQLAPESAAAHYALGGVLMISGQIVAAIAAYHEAERWVPVIRDSDGYRLSTRRVIDGTLDPDVVFMRRVFRARRGKSAEYGRRRRAEPVTDQTEDLRVIGMQEFLFLRADDPNTFHQLALALDRAGRPEEALAACREAIRLDALDRGAAGPDDLTTELYRDLGRLLKKQGQLEEAGAAFKRASRPAPPRSPVRRAVSGALRRLVRRLDEQSTSNTA